MTQSDGCTNIHTDIHMYAYIHTVTQTHVKKLTGLPAATSEISGPNF